MRILLTCEHATNHIPARYAKYFRGQKALLASHRGWDEGALTIAKILAKRFGCELIAGSHSRLLADLNRTPDNQGVFSEFNRHLTVQEKAKILEEHHAPHWLRVQKAVKKLLGENEEVLHVGVHSFAPVLHGLRRRTDIGLLYDSRRPREEHLCLAWQKQLKKSTELRIHRNLPYRGSGNGLITHFRAVFPAESYLGVELEVNQRLLGKENAIAQGLADSLAAFLV